MKQLRLEVIFGARNKLSPALKIILGSSNAASRALKKTRDEIRALNQQQKKIDGYQKQKKAVLDQAKALGELQKHIKNLRQQMKTNPSADLTREFDKSVAKAKKLKQEYEKNRIALQRMRTDMNNAGLSTNRLSDHQQRLRNQLNQANQSMREQEQRLRRMSQLQQNYERRSGHLRGAAMGGMTAAMTGAGALYAMRKPIEESKHVDIEQNRIGALGLGKEATKEATDYAKAMKTFGTSTLDNLTIMRDGITAFADVHHAQMVAPTLAKMKFGNEAMFGAEDGAENDRKMMDMLKVIELRGGLKSEKAFKDQANIVQQVITATGGRVQGGEWLNAIKTGGVAVKGMSNEALYYKMEPIVQELGGHRFGTAAMSAYQNIYQGRTTVRAARNMADYGLLDGSKVTYDKVGQVAHLNPGALKGGELFKQDQFAWMEQVLLPALAKKGITEKGQIHDAMGSMFTNRTASNLFTTMYDQREQIHKNAKLNAGAENIDQLSERAKGTTSGKELEAKAKLHDAYLQFGLTILPIYTKALVMATSAMQSFTGWMERNPTLAKALGAGLVFIAVSLVAIGGALAIFSPLILGMFSLRLIMMSTATGATIFSRVFAAVPAVFNILKASLMMLGRVFLLVGRMMLANPILLAITLIATAAYLIYKNWGPIKEFFIGIWGSIKAGATEAWEMTKSTFAPVGAWFSFRWGEIKTAFSGGIAGISALILNWSPLGLFYTVFAKVLSWFGIQLPSTFTGFGSMLIDGLIKGIMSGFEKLKAVWATITNYIPSFFKNGMKIRSPSRVMAGLGGHVMTGLNVGLDKYFPSLKSKFSDVLGIFKASPDFLQKINLEPNFAQVPQVPKIFASAQQQPTITQKIIEVLRVFKPDTDILQKVDVKPALANIRPTQAISESKRNDVVIQGDTIAIHIHQAVGQSVQEMRNMLEGMLKKHEQQKQTRIRSSFKDQD